MRPLFLLSLPRSGSTFVQRVLGAHDEIATASEPWVLLPLLYATRRHGARAEYGHVSAAEAIDDFQQELDGGAPGYREELRDFVERLYARAAPDGAAYFLDKTPRYHFVAEELPRLFPDARFVVLWRNPLAVLASLLDTFRGGRFEPQHFARDLVDGPVNLVAARRAAGDRAVTVRYEDLVARGDAAWRDVFAALDVDYDPALLERFTNVRLRGRYGDPTGIRRYQAVSTDSVERWRTTLAGPVRTAWCRRWLDRLGDDVLDEMGYPRRELVAALDEGRGRPGLGALRDVFHAGTAAAEAGIRARALHLNEGPQPIGEAFDPPARLLPRVATLARGRGRARV